MSSHEETASPSIVNSRTHGHRHKTQRGITAVIGYLFALVLATNPVRAADIDQPIETVWKPQLIELNYWSSHVHYSCIGIATKVAATLKRLGARPDVEVWSENCHSGMLSSRHLVKIRVATPFAATPELLQELTTFDATDELIARVRGEELPSVAEVTRFTAGWQPVSLSMDFDAGDCELVQMLRNEVLPKLSVRVVASNRYCSFFGPSVAPRLKVVALLPLLAVEP